MQIVFVSERLGRVDLTERAAGWAFESWDDVGFAEGRVRISAPARDLWVLADCGADDSLEFWLRGKLVWRGYFCGYQLSTEALTLYAEGDGLRLRDAELWQVFSDADYVYWIPADHPPSGFSSDNNNRVWVAASDGDYVGGEEQAVVYPEDDVELGATIVRMLAHAEVSVPNAAWVAEIRTDDGTVVWSQTADYDGDIDLTIAAAAGLEAALRITAKLERAGELTAALAGAGAGTLSAGTYRYRVSFVTAVGTCPAGDYASVDVADPAVDGQVSLSSIPTGATGTTARIVWRTAADGDEYKVLTTLADNVTTTYTDNTADTGLGTALEDASSFRLTQVVVRTLEPITSTLIASDILSAAGVAEFQVDDSGLEVDRAIWQGSTRLAALREMAALGDGSEAWLFLVFEDGAEFRAWRDDVDWLFLPEDTGWSLEWQREAVVNRVRAELPDGWRSSWLEDADSIERWGEREYTLSLPMTTQAEAERQAQIYLSEYAWPMAGLRLDAGARCHKPDRSGGWPVYFIRAGDVIQLRDIVCAEDIVIQVAEAHADERGVRIVPVGDVSRLDVMLAALERKVGSRE